MKPETIAYKKSRFSSRLPVGCRYTPSHYWLREREPGLWEIGFTKFATRMLGDIVEFELRPETGAAVEPGQVIGWIEGFKALSDIYCAARGEFCGSNPALRESITKIDDDPYGEGWLYLVRGEPDPRHMDVHGYISLLDATIEKMLEGRHDG